jgi:poly[(R)-3-hydroxyalkanoate] polymerase subunit PhaC
MVPDPQRWLQDLMSAEHAPWAGLDPSAPAKAMAAALAPWTKAVADVTALQLDAMRRLATPWLGLLPGAPEPGRVDRRFAGDAWQGDPRYEAVARTYLAQVELLRRTLDAAPVDERSKAQWGFALGNVLDALSPANTLATNPEAMQLALESGGASLVEGFRLFTEDLARGRIAMTDESAFEVGHNVATTPGTVVFQNDLIQLIQYTPTTSTVHRRPLVIVPPCINKYYILDLQPANSFVGHAVAEGHVVFLVSWRNVQADQGTLTWDDYLEQGVVAALDTALAITKADLADTLGFCIGGTLLACALAVLAARGRRPASSMTLLTTMLDFTETGDIGLLVTPEGVAAREAAIGQGGLLRGRELSQVFASLRANDLIWPYVVNGYLKGKPPPAFDLLYWNSDDTNLPGPMFCWYVRNTYLENKLREPGATVQLGERVDLSAIDVPTFVYASKDDHIVPWRTAYASTQLLSGEVRFVLGASGHIAGVINPPEKNKRSHWVAADGGGAPAAPDADPDRWFAAADEVAGSWWPAWYAWLAQRSGTKVRARKTAGSAAFPAIEPAPGAYVRAKAG